MLTRRILVPTLALGFVFAALASPAAAQQSPSCEPSRVMMLLDRSSSMARYPDYGNDSVTKNWDHAVSALDTVATGFENDLELGLMQFPEPNECGPGATYVEPTQLGNRDAIMTALDERPPQSGNYTPLYQTLAAAAEEPSLNAADNPDKVRYAILITDGAQCCYGGNLNCEGENRLEPITSVETLAGEGVKTFVVGFGQTTDTYVMNQMAVAGGTARAGCDPDTTDPGASNLCYYQADDPSELTSVLMDIADQATDEVCDGLDNDCDGEVDEDLVRSCASDCGSGEEMCVDGEWQGCDAPQPEEEICDGADNDCDGDIDPGCDCTPGETMPCDVPDSDLGACTAGTQTCQGDGTWGSCEGAVGDEPEMCDAVDNDCDGDVDESDDDVLTLCGVGQQCVDGQCEDIDQPQPEPTDGAQPANGDVASGCGCDAGTKTSGTGPLAGGALLALLGLAVLRRQGARQRAR